jgi:hypothetical protein
MTTNRTHRARLARALAALADIGYQTALARVIAAADAGALPPRLDEAGMRQALDILLAATAPDRASQAGSALRLQPRYYRLAEMCPGRLSPGVSARVNRAATLGMPAARDRGDHDPLDILDAATSGDNGDGDDPDAQTDWWRRLIDTGTRRDFALPDPYPPGTFPDGSVPIDRALDRRDATGDVDAYEHDLRAIIRAEPRDIDAHAHLGHLYLSLASPGGDLVVTPPADARQQRAWLRTALGHYQTGVGIAELALPDPFTGFLVWSELDFTDREIACR